VDENCFLFWEKSGNRIVIFFRDAAMSLLSYGEKLIAGKFSRQPKISIVC